VTWPGEPVMKLMVPEDVTYVLAQETLNTFPEFLRTFDVILIHIPTSIFVISCLRRETLD
jgi:hypothetical protein